MNNKVIHFDKHQIELINLIDEWLRDEMMETSTTYSEVEVISDARIFLTKILEKGWYREGGDDQSLLMYLRKQWIDGGGKWKAN
jgi:hypothetical protein